MNTNITIVIRSSNERTHEACLQRTKQQVPEQNIFILNETPFLKAVKRTFEIGLEHKNKYTLAIDADILLTENAIDQMATQFDKLRDPTFVLQGYVLDKLYGEYRQGGPHLYNTELLEKALKTLKGYNTRTLRPESSTYNELATSGYSTNITPEIYGIHDYEQYYYDIYRKAFFHAVKHRKNGVLSKMLSHWANKITRDKDYQIALYGASHGLLYTGQTKPDINFFNKVSTNAFSSLNIIEKLPLTDGQLIDFDTIISEHDLAHPHARKSLKNIVINKYGKKKKSKLTLADKAANKFATLLINVGKKISRKK